MFNNRETIEINKKLLIQKKLEEQKQDMLIREAIAEAESKKIDAWWEEEQKKIVPWSPEYRAFMEAHTFTPNEKTSERYNRQMTNTWKRLENR